jgi:hypothetical protein
LTYDGALRLWVETVYGRTGSLAQGEYARIYDLHDDTWAEEDDTSPDHPIRHTADDSDNLEIMPGDLLVYAIRLFNQGTASIFIDEVTFHASDAVILAPVDLRTQLASWRQDAHFDGWRAAGPDTFVYSAADDPRGEHVELAPGQSHEIHLIVQVTEAALDSADGTSGEFTHYAEISAMSGLAQVDTLSSGAGTTGLGLLPLTSGRLAANKPSAPAGWAWVPVLDQDSELRGDNFGATPVPGGSLTSGGSMVYNNHVQDNVINERQLEVAGADRDNHDGHRTVVVLETDTTRLFFTDQLPSAPTPSGLTVDQRFMSVTGVGIALLVAAGISLLFGTGYLVDPVTAMRQRRTPK